MTADRISVGDVLARIVETYQRTAGVLIPAALIVFAPVALLVAIGATGAPALSLIGGIASIVVSVWYAGMVVKTVEDVQDGRVDASIGQLFESAAPVLGQLLLVGLLGGLGIVLGLVLFIVPGIVLLAWWSVAAPVAVIERPGVIASLRRSRELVQGNTLPVLGVIVLVGAIAFVISIVVGSLGFVGDSFVLAFTVQLLLNALLAPLSGLGQAVLYFELGGHRSGAIEGPAAPLPPVEPAAGWQAPSEPDRDAFGNPAAPPAPAVGGGFAPSPADPAGEVIDEPAVINEPSGLEPDVVDEPPAADGLAPDPAPAPDVEPPAPAPTPPPAATQPTERKPGESIPPPGFS